MNNLKLSKASQLMLSAGVFIIILAGLGITNSRQMQEKGQLDEQLYISQERLEKLTVSELQEQLKTLEEKTNVDEEQIYGAREILQQSIESVDVTDRFFVIAEQSSVNVTGLSTTVITKTPLEAIICSTISLSAAVTGNVTDLVQFIINLNGGYVSGYVDSAQIVIPGACEDAEPMANIQMIAYSSEET
jgi:hypothetical protein